MVKQRFNKNTLPLLAITALLLSVSLANYNDPLYLDSRRTQSVLSDSDQLEDENKSEDKKEDDKKDEDKKEDNKKDDSVDEKIDYKSNIDSKNEKLKTIKIEEEIEIEEDESIDDQSIENNHQSDEENVSDSENESEIEIESEAGSQNGTTNKFKLKIKSKVVDGKTVVETTSGEVEVETDPDDAINSLVEDGFIDEPSFFEAKLNNGEKVEFEVQGIEIKKFLGLFEVNLPKTVTIDAETGSVTSSNQNIWTRFLSLLSI